VAKMNKAGLGETNEALELLRSYWNFRKVMLDGGQLTGSFVDEILSDKELHKQLEGAVYEAMKDVNISITIIEDYTDSFGNPASRFLYPKDTTVNAMDTNEVKRIRRRKKNR
jgi:hypothetical protein